MASLPPSSPGSVDVLLLGSSVDVVRRGGRSIERLLRSRFDCEVQILGLDLDSERARPGSRPHVAPEKRLETMLNSGVKVSVWRADLANFTVDAVVNAANSKLQHAGGLALALSEAGGAEVQRESYDYVKKNGEVKTGEAVALGAGNLRCKRIIHAVGPHLSYRPNAHEVSASKNQLERVVRSILKIVEAEKLEKVAIPAISSGIFNFPVAECADVIVNTIKTFYGSITTRLFKPREVLLVNNDDPTVKEMVRACQMLLPVPMSSSPTAAVTPQTSATHSQAVASGATHQTKGGRNKPAHPEVQLGLVKVLLMKHCLEEMKTDVIVNTIGSDRQLNAGQVSKTLLRKAGPELQREIYKAPERESVIVTQGYGLFCKDVYHICCPLKSSYKSNEMMSKSVMASLWYAIGSNHRSIAFPAIGTGNLGFMDRDSAYIMMDAVWNFAQKSPQQLDVVFVIYHSDHNRYKAFEAELNCLRQRPFHRELLQGSTEEAHGPNEKPALPSSHEAAVGAWEAETKKSPREPCIRLQSSSGVRRAEAEAWLRGLLYNQFHTVYTISNNFIQLLGERDLEELAQTEVEGVQVEEFLEKGRSGFIVNANKEEEMMLTALKLQEMLQEVQKKYLREEVHELKAEAGGKVQMERNPVSRDHADVKPFIKQLQKHGLETIMAEKVENPALEKVFKQQKSQMLSNSTTDMFQFVSAQFCDIVSTVGFRPECAPPHDPFLGEGLYFAADIDVAQRLWGGSDRFLYVFVAEVLKGRSGLGRPGLVLAPDLDSMEKYGVTLIFNHRQALPRFIFTCMRDRVSTHV